MPEGRFEHLDEIDHLLTTTKAVRQRLELTRRVDRALVRECIQIGCYAPNASNAQEWRWVVVDEPELLAEVAAQYRAVTVPPVTQMLATKEANGDEAGARISRSILWLAEHLREVPVLVIPCYDIAAAEARYRTLIPDDTVREAAGGVARQEMTSGMYASILPAVWSFQLALRSRGLGSVMTTAHQADQPAMAEILGIPTTWDQTCLIPVAHVDGDFKRSPRKPVDDVIVWNRAGVPRASEPLVVHVGYWPLAPVVDAGRLAEIAGRPVDLRTVSYDLDHTEQTHRDREPHAADLPELELGDELLAALADAEVMLTLNAPLELSRLAPKLRWIQAMGSGVGQFVASNLPAGDVTLTNAAGVGAAPIAEWVVGRVLQVYKRFDEHAARQQRHEWTEALGALLEGRTALVVGVGAIGSAVAVRLRAFGVHTIGVKRSYTPGMTDPSVDELIGPDDLLDSLPRAHVVVVAAPGTAANENLFDETAFATMRPGAVFVNVARGTLVLEDALIGALASGHLRAAAIDVAREEPLPADNPLWDAPNLAISPHSSASADRYLERVVDLFADNLGRYVRGEPLRNVVDLSGGY